MRVVGDVDAVRRVTFKVGRRMLGRDAAAPFRHTIGRRALRRWRGRILRAIVEVTRGPDSRVKRRLTLRCG